MKSGPGAWKHWSTCWTWRESVAPSSRYLEPLGLADAIAAATERLHHASHDRVVAWDRPVADIDVLADWDRLGQILDNLLANADRFAPPDTPITLQASKDDVSGLATIRVIDRGPGVATELRERLFERFVRGDAKADQAQSAGTGLGALAIVGKRPQ